MPEPTEPCVLYPRVFAIIAMILATLATASGSPAQSTAIPAPIHDELTLSVTDVSDSDAPIKMTAGQISFRQDVYPTYVKTTCTTQITLTNVSWRGVLAYEVLVRGTPHYQGWVNRTDRVEGFFRPTANFAAGSQEPLDYDCSSKTSTAHDDVPNAPQRNEAPQATFKLLFVQFADGATYGVSEWGEHLHEGRAAEIEKLKELLHSYQTGGEDGLRVAMDQALASPDNPSYVQSDLRTLDYHLKTEGARAFILKISDRLQAAELHHNVM